MIYVGHLINCRFIHLLMIEILIPLIERVVSAKLSKVQDWLVVNKLTLNAKKSNFVTFHP